MAITFERLDSEDINKEITIITGKEVIFKIYPRTPIYNIFPEVKKLIGFKGVHKNENLKKIKDLISLHNERTNIIKDLESLKKRSLNFLDEQEQEQRKFAQKAIIELEEEKLKLSMDRLKEISKNVWEICNFLKSKLGEKKELCFCSKCNFIISSIGIQEITQCDICKNKVTKTSNRIYIVIPEKIKEYLEGDWFADFIAKKFESQGWKTWTNMYVLGGSGIAHEIDILTINKKLGLSLIGECKTGKIGRKDIFNFSTKSQEISSTYAYLFNIEAILESETKKFMDRNGLLFVENIKMKEEKGLIEEIFQNL